MGAQDFSTDPEEGAGVILRKGTREERHAGSQPGASSVHPAALPWCSAITGGSSAPLADPARLVAVRSPDKAGSTSEFRYCGAAEVEGHPCIEVRADWPGGNRSGASFVLYLATDRNDIPIKMEYYANSFGRWQVMPTGISRCDDFREIARRGSGIRSTLTEVGIDIAVGDAR